MNSGPGVAYAGIDLGTSGVKVLLVGVDGAALARARSGYDLHRPQPGAAEADPEDWWRAIGSAMRAALAQVPGVYVAALGLSGQMHGLVLAGNDGTPVRPALTWADTRAVSDVDRWRALPAPVRARLGNPLVPGMTGPLLARLARTEPALVARATWALTAKDWVRLRLTGVAATDPSDASATLLWDLPRDGWALDVLRALDLPADLLPDVRPSARAAGSVTAAAAADLAVPQGIPVATGAADAAAALLGTAPGPGRLQLTLGTGAQLLRDGAALSGAADPVTHTYRTAAPVGWYAMAAVQNFGLALDWARRTLSATWDELYATLALPGDPRRLPLLVPYLTGERTPVVSSSVRAGWHGLDLAHTREDLLRSAVVGAVCAVRDARDALLDLPTGTLWLAGGGSRPPALRQLVADLLGSVVAPVLADDASAWGAASLAASAAGSPLPEPATECGPIIEPGDAVVWDEVFAGYRSMARALVAQEDPR